MQPLTAVDQDFASCFPGSQGSFSLPDSTQNTFYDYEIITQFGAVAFKLGQLLNQGLVIDPTLNIHSPWPSILTLGPKTSNIHGF
jgi:hypothetical protein